MYKTVTTPPTRLSPGLDFNIGGEFDIGQNWRIWLQMNNLFNNTYQRWNQYPVFGFNVMAGVVYSF
jgi:outer membrane receptor protein involved in Fe transport